MLLYIAHLYMNMYVCMHKYIYIYMYIYIYIITFYIMYPISTMMYIYHILDCIPMFVGWNHIIVG